MKNNMMFGYMMYLSNHMWDDENTPARGWYVPKRYSESIGVDVEAWDETVRTLAAHKYNAVLIDVGDGIKYESRPEISAPDAWDKDFLKKKLDEMRALGLEPIPKLNFSTCHHTWLKEYRRMTSTRYYYEACADVIREVCEVFGNPRLFHLGMDEEDTIGNQRFRECVHIRAKDLWWHDVYFYFGEVEKYGARPWVWADGCWENPDTYIEKMPKAVLQSNWYYNMFKDWPSDHWHYKAISAYELLEKNGYDQVPCSSFAEGISSNIESTLVHGKKVISPAHLTGFLVAPWLHTKRENLLLAKYNIQLMNRAREALYPETL